ncbi:response regulator, partial [Candidatus Poribacteria bacterium]|nr:response regulator [Candidatus Poribacteria bacterium]
KLPQRENENTIVMGSGKILLMDDEEIIRNLVSEILIKIGYEVKTAKNGQDAINLYIKAQKTGKPFALVILDLNIQYGMGGIDTINQIKKINPHVKAILTSGYSSDPAIKNYTKHGFNNVIIKPFKFKELSQVLYKSINREET